MIESSAYLEAIFYHSILMDLDRSSSPPRKVFHPSSCSAFILRFCSSVHGEDPVQKQPHRVLAIPELIRNIFQYSEDEDCASGALVSRTIGEVALDVLWREMDSLFPLLNVLSPLWPEGWPAIWVGINQLPHFLPHLSSSADVSKRSLPG